MRWSRTGNLSDRKVGYIAAALLCLLVLQAVGSMRLKTATMDEGRHLEAGKYLSRFQFEYEPILYDPPFSYYIHGFILRPFTFSDFEQEVFWARLCMLPFSVILGYYVFRWAKDLHGNSAGLLALFLYTFSPNILAHSRLITTNIAMTCLCFITTYYFWKAAKGSNRCLVYCGIAFGLALLSKYPSAFFAPILILLGMLVVLWPRQQGFLRGVFRRLESGGLGTRTAALSLALVVVFGLGVFLLNLGYGFKGSFRPMRSSHFQSDMLVALARSPLVGSLPLPVPAPYVQALDHKKNFEEAGDPGFLMGKRSPDGWWYFYPIAFFLKTPIVTSLLIILSLIFFKRLRPKDSIDEWFVLLPVLFLILSWSMPGPKRSELRHVLPIFPFLFVFVSRVASLRFERRWVAPVGSVILLGWYMASSLSIYPHYLAYFNELVGPKNGYKFLVDSNLDWSQDRRLLSRYVSTAGPGIVVNPGCTPAVGEIIISANDLQDCFRPRDCHGWLRRFEPVDNVGYSWLVFDLKEEDFQKVVADDPADADAHYALGWVYLQRLKYREAHDEFQAALSLNPGHAKTYNAMGLFQLGEGSLAKAIANFRKTLEIEPSFVEARRNLSLVYAEAGRFDEAETVYKQAVVQEIVNSYVRGIPLDARSYEEMLMVEPQDPMPYNNLGFLHWKEGRLDEAIHFFQQALERDPDLLATYGNLVVVYEERGDFDEAIRSLQAYEDLSRLARAHRSYGTSFLGEQLNLGDTFEIFPFGNAEVLRMRQALAARPDDTRLRTRLAKTHYEYGDQTRAFIEFKKASQQDAGNPEPYLFLSRIYEEKGLLEKAMALCEEAIALNPNLPSGRLLRARYAKKLSSIRSR